MLCQYPGAEVMVFGSCMFEHIKNLLSDCNQRAAEFSNEI